MARVLAPCGSPAAYRRHKRRGETVDAACAEAARIQKNDRVAAKATTSAAVVRLKIAENQPSPVPIDELEKARWNLAIVEAAMSAGVSTGMAALSKRHEDLVSVIRRLEERSKPKESKLDELARRRADRLADSTG